MVMIMNGAMIGMATMNVGRLFRRSSQVVKSCLALWFFLFILFPMPFNCAVSHAVVMKPSSLCKVEHPSDSKVAWECRRIRSGEKVEELFGEQWEDLLRFNRIDRRHTYIGISMKVPARLEDIKDFSVMPQVYPAAEN